MKILFLSKSKKFTNRALRYFIDNKHEVVGVVCKSFDTFVDSEMHQICRELDINVYDNDSVYSALSCGSLGKVDLIVSFIYGKLIKKSLIDYVNGNCINIHPAPLPQYRGLFPYNFCILNQEKEWGVTAHFVSEKFDKGDIIKVVMFPIDSEGVTLKELVELSSRESYDLLVEVIKNIEMGKEIRRSPQGEGNYYSRSDFEAAKIITIQDSPSTINRKIRAFWYPPYEGAYIKLNGEKYCLVNADIIKQLNAVSEEKI